MQYVCVCVSRLSTGPLEVVCVRGGGCAGAASVSAGYVDHETEIQLISLQTLEASVVSDDAFASESCMLFKL